MYIYIVYNVYNHTSYAAKFSPAPPPRSWCFLPSRWRNMMWCPDAGEENQQEVWEDTKKWA